MHYLYRIWSRLQSYLARAARGRCLSRRTHSGVQPRCYRPYLWSTPTCIPLWVWCLSRTTRECALIWIQPGIRRWLSPEWTLSLDPLQGLISIRWRILLLIECRIRVNWVRSVSYFSTVQVMGIFHQVQSLLTNPRVMPLWSLCVTPQCLFPFWSLTCFCLFPIICCRNANCLNCGCWDARPSPPPVNFENH